MATKLYKISIVVILVSVLAVVCINIKFNLQDTKNNLVEDLILGQQENILYFAYGSNMNLNQMTNRCPHGFEKYGNKLLDDYILGFDQSGYANIKEQKDNFVDGVVYKISKECLKNLDGYEGYPTHYNRKIVSIYDFDTRTTLKPWVYIQPPENFGGVPNESYLNTIIQGAEENKLPADYIIYLKSLK